MFRSQSMRKVELIVPGHDVIPVTEALAAAGCFHLCPTQYMDHDTSQQTDSKWHDWAATFATLERRILSVMEVLAVDEGIPPEAPHLIEPDVAQRDIEHLEKEIQTPLHELEEAQRRLAMLERYLTQLEPIADLDVDLGTLRQMRYTYAMLGMMPSNNIERLRNSLEHIPFILVALHEQDHLTAVILFGLQRDAEILERAARSAYINPLRPPETYRGTPADAIAALHAGIERARQHIREDQMELEHLHEIRIRHLRHLLWRVRASRKLVETISSYGHLRFTYQISGWVPASQVPHLETYIQSVSKNTAIDVNVPKSEHQAISERDMLEQDIPVTMENPPLIRAFQGLVTNYGYPRYGELDPVSIVALTFPLIFGIMFGDVGHGLFLGVLGLLLASRKIRALHGLAGMGVVIGMCGISAMIFGFLYGSVFGFETLLDPLWIRPLEDIMAILITTVGIGTLLLSLGMVYNIINHFLAKKWSRGLLDHNGLAGLAFYWSLIGLAMTIFIPNFPLQTGWLIVTTLISGGTMTFAGVLERLLEGKRPLVEESWGTYFMEAFFELFETLIGLLSNTLSYVRMGAFAVAHGALSLVVFIIAEIISPTQGVGYWLTIALGNLFVIGFEGMIVGIQTLRLEYYEFFSKFFSGDGKHYHPLSLVPKEGQEL